MQGALRFLTENKWFRNVPQNLLVTEPFWNKTEGKRRNYLGFRKHTGVHTEPFQIQTSEGVRGFELPGKVNQLSF